MHHRKENIVLRDSVRWLMAVDELKKDGSSLSGTFADLPRECQCFRHKALISHVISNYSRNILYLENKPGIYKDKFDQ